MFRARLLLFMLVIGATACEASAPSIEFTDERQDLLEHCGVPGQVRWAIEQRMIHPTSFQWHSTVGARPSEDSLAWGRADANGESQFVARVRGFNPSGTLVDSRWGGIIDRDTCAVKSLAELERTR